MRGRMNRRQYIWCGQKRALLRLALLAAAPMLATSILPEIVSAQSPADATELLLPPLPLSGPGDWRASTQQINPFCQPAPSVNAFMNAPAASVAKPSLGSPRPAMDRRRVDAMPTIQLASGNPTLSNLDSIDQQQATTFRLIPPSIEPQAQPSSNAVVGQIRINPALVTAAASHESDEQSFPVDDIVHKVVGDANRTATIAANAVDKALQQVTRAGGRQTVGKSVAKVNAVAGPVTFSLDDERLVDTSSLPTKTAPAKTAPIKSVNENKSLASLLRGGDELENDEPIASVAQEKASHRNVTISEPMDEDPAASITRGKSAGRMLLVPLPSVNDSLPISEPPNADARIIKGGRPRVDVGVPRVAIARQVNALVGVPAPVADSPKIKESSPPTAAAKPAATSKVAPEKAEIDIALESSSVIPLELKRTEVRSLKADGEIRNVQIGDGSVCAAVAAGPTHLQLIGTRDGVTRMAVWSADSAGNVEKRVYEITVGMPVRSDANDPATIASTLTNSAKTAFPDSDLQVRYETGRLIVEGSCASNESAKQALRMIRSACQLPVVDQVIVR